jgi:hypothetical protein
LPFTTHGGVFKITYEKTKAPFSKLESTGTGLRPGDPPKIDVHVFKRNIKKMTSTHESKDNANQAGQTGC